MLAYDGGEGSFDEIAETFDVARCHVGRLLKSTRSGSGFAPKPYGGSYSVASLFAFLLADRGALVEGQDTCVWELRCAYRRI